MALIDGDPAVLDSPFPYTVYNKLKDHFYGAFGPTGPQSGMVYVKDDGRIYVYYGAAWIPFGGGQVAFPALQIPSADANTLDDYEEGTWTPDLQFGGLKVGLTYNIQAGLYTKKGREVTLTCYIELTSKGTSVGEAAIKALPFTVANTDGAYSASSLWIDAISFANIPQAFARRNSTIIDLGEITEAGVYTTLNNTNFANDSAMIISVTYFV